MQLREVLEIIEGKVISMDVDLTREVSLGGGADLMSDLLAFGQEGMLLMTGLTNPQVVRTADMAGVAAIVFVRGKIPPPETINLASQKGIPLLASKYTMFETCGRLYKAGLAASTLFETILKQWYGAFDTKKRDDARP
jgi:predicted transcriptional regulator